MSLTIHFKSYIPLRESDKESEGESHREKNSVIKRKRGSELKLSIIRKWGDLSKKNTD